MRVRLGVVIGALLLLSTACNKPYEMDHDNKTTLAWFEQSTGEWRVQDTTVPAGYKVIATAAGSVGIAGDYDGDGYYDPGTVAAGVLDTHSGAGSIPFTSPPNTPLVFWSIPAGPTLVTFPHYVFGAYDGSRKTLPASYRDGDATWFISGHEPHVFGKPAHTGGLPDWSIPVPGDYDGDGTTDLAVFQPATGDWDVEGRGVVATSGRFAIPLPGDWNGDGTTDAAFLSADGKIHVPGEADITPPINMNESNAVPLPGDYDGDGRIEPGTLISNGSTRTWRTTVHQDGVLVAGPVVNLPGTSTPAPTIGVVALVENYARFAVLWRCQTGAYSCP